MSHLTPNLLIYNPYHYKNAFHGQFVIKIYPPTPFSFPEILQPAFLYPRKPIGFILGVCQISGLEIWVMWKALLFVNC
jgi:hypothetical protein